MPHPVSQAYVPATKPVTREEVFDACNRLQAAGAKVTQTAVREALGKRGSMATISPLMRDWRASLDLLADDDDDEEGGSTGAKPTEQEGGPTVGEERESEEEPRQRPVEGRMALTVKDYEDRRSELTTQVHAQVEKYFRELITVERTAAMHAARLEEREAAAKAIQQAEKTIREAAAAEIEASVTRERERAIETLAQQKQVATAQRWMWIVVAIAVGILVGGGGVYVATARVSPEQLDDRIKEAIAAPTAPVPGAAPAASALAPTASSQKATSEEVAVPAEQTSKPVSDPGEHKAPDTNKLAP